MDEIFRKNNAVLKKLYEQSHLASSKFISPEECILIAKKAALNLTDQKLTNCYVESLMSRVDTMKDLRMAKQMRYVEFLVFIARIAHEIYSSTKQESMELADKIESILDPLLETASLVKIFSFSMNPSAEKEYELNTQ